MSALIEIEGVTKRFGAIVAVDDVTLNIAEGEFFALLGPSGCGKTTLLRLLAGFETPNVGRIRIDGRDQTRVPPHRRPVNMVFQSYALFPHLSVRGNVEYGLKVAGVPPAERRRRVDEVLALVQLEGLADRMPDQLSGGQRQRVALARALVKRPRVVLLDEPLSALDAKLREELRFELSRLQHHLGLTFVMVTHDQDEALALATRCAVMHRGALVQVGTPAELYEFPASRLVAEFIGAVNLFEGRVITDAPDHAVIDLPGEGIRAWLDHGTGLPGVPRLWLAVRPEKMELHKRAGGRPAPRMEGTPPGHNVLAGTIREIAYLGSESVFDVELETGRRVRVIRPNLTHWDQEDFGRDEPVWLGWHAEAAVVLAR
ncbi:MAG: ABC transporter ATP-binding protein [Sphingomonadaceae bacterium]|uniref:ABC transporter ATP-binding protein n=1 Tax=Thermaurantiacus sp. TaxID=2820283 RepID=UPI00298ED325|nr:ABC transporter ATP-binding protein [Thermaurantiacus sp.]MCS6986878.1 ABC transporter ATP-binding protein [Sphingomonadaceae bacterium]MDW8415522.1 ABC transporter ATP-binding protein [Thermaurantiacus sp.]